MKIHLLVIVALFASTQLFASAETKEFSVNGIKVIFKPSPKEVISVRLFVSGGTANYPKDKEGIEALAFQTAIDGGTKTLDKTAFHTEAEKIGAEFSSSTTYDYGTLNMGCIAMFWDKSWKLFADAVMNPAFDEKEFNLIKEQMISSAKMVESDPDNHLRNLAMENVFKGKNYAKIPEGTAESLEKLTLEDVKKYYASTVGRKRCFLVVVGNVDEQDLKQKIESSLGQLQEGTPAAIERKHYIVEPAVYIEDRDIATNYIRGLMTAPHMSTKDGIAMRVVMSILQDRFFVELRTKRSLSYAPGAFYSTGVINNPYSVLYISTQDPAQSIQVMIDVINGIKKDGFTPKDLNHKQQSFLTHYYMGQENSSAQSLSLGMAEVGGDWKQADALTERVNALTLNDLNSAIKKYTNAIQWTYLGKKAAVTEKDFKQLKYDKKNLPY